ncbi:hypothetical protein HMPREF0058_0167 [Actinomyces urogenitalis DSM 15434]|uniref:Uncharacterized protein n=1 Tax=Actinomyces urogenitalis DSM 15434 TaxID=525246 RepID=C0W2S3_9ACTO|nr:hypothetical protein HMPREF0058_0167 [Actinomyces urogenitalis DSM 15434]
MESRACQVPRLDHAERGQPIGSVTLTSQGGDNDVSALRRP